MKNEKLRSLKSFFDVLTTDDEREVFRRTLFLLDNLVEFENFYYFDSLTDEQKETYHVIAAILKKNNLKIKVSMFDTYLEELDYFDLSDEDKETLRNSIENIGQATNVYNRIITCY